VTEKAVVDLQRERGRWVREGYDVRRTSAMMGLNRDKIIQICRLTGGVDSVYERIL